jgi:hypothetical protein
MIGALASGRRDIQVRVQRQRCRPLGSPSTRRCRRRPETTRSRPQPLRRWLCSCWRHRRSRRSRKAPAGREGELCQPVPAQLQAHDANLEALSQHGVRFSLYVCRRSLRFCTDDRLGDIRHFLAVAQSGALSGAARALKVDHATVSRRLAALEAALDVRLVDRLPRSCRLTTIARPVI